MRRGAGAAVAIAWALLGCRTDPSPGAPCSAAADCPREEECVGGRCRAVVHGSPEDGGRDGRDGSPDALDDTGDADGAAQEDADGASDAPGLDAPPFDADAGDAAEDAGDADAGGDASCTGAPGECADGLDCTDDVCTGSPARCVHLLSRGHCLIDDVCYLRGATNPANDCLVCESLNTELAWTPNPPSTPCDDGLWCTERTSCDGAGACGNGEPHDCDDGVTCTVDTCDEATDACEHTEPPASDQCHIGGACVAAGVHNPLDDCEVCDPAADAGAWSPRGVGASCDDGLWCTTGDACNALGQCIAAAIRACADGLGCTDDACDEALDRCDHAITGGYCLMTTLCFEDGDPHPEEACLECDPGTDPTDWSNRPNGSGCDDGDLCTLVDACSGGACVGTGAVVCSATDACHVGGTCDPPTGLCSDPTAPDGTACDDASPCTTGDECTSGLCAGTGCDTFERCDVLGCVARSWSAETISTAADADWPSLALDPADDAVVAYQGGALQSLHVVTRVGGVWQAPAEVDPGSKTGFYTSLTVDPATGARHVAHYDEDDRDARYAFWDGASWSAWAVSTTGDRGSHAAIALDPSGRPTLAFRDATDKDLFVATTGFPLSPAPPLPPTWSFVALDRDTTDHALAVAPSGETHIAFREGSAGLRYLTSAAWSAATTLDASTGAGEYTAIALEPSSGAPHIVYARAPGPSGTLWHAWHTTSWQLEQITTGSLGPADLAIDSAGRLHVLFIRTASPRYVMYTRKDDGAWSTPEAVDTAVSPMGDAVLSLALASDDLPSVVYAGPSSTLRYAALR